MVAERAPRTTHSHPQSIQLFFLIIAVAALLAPANLWGQVNLGSIHGTVVDTSHAAIPGAQLTLLSEETGISQTATSNGAGEFSFLNLTPDTYDLTSSAQGFNTFCPEGH